MSPPRPSVLIVDDEPYLVDIFEAHLSRSFSVTTASTGEDALDILDESIDLVSLDRRMPGLSGDEVLERIHAAEWSGSILMVSAVEPDDPDVAGWDGYLEKPIEKDEYVETIASLIKSAE